MHTLSHPPDTLDHYVHVKKILSWFPCVQQSTKAIVLKYTIKSVENSNDVNFVNEKTLQCLKMKMKCGDAFPLKVNDELVRELLMPNE